MSRTPDTSFVPELDARQRAMLAEMGVRVWAPKAPAAAQPAATTVVTPPTTPARAAAPVSRQTPTPPAAPEPARQAGPASPVATLDWPELRAAVAGCEACGLCQGRTQTVFGTGDEQADWMVVGEAPGENEDLQGEPFVGAAGQLLDNMLKAVGRSRTGQGAEGAFITNVLKCRPPANRNPQADEVASCEPYLARQVALVKPKVIVAMGRFAVQALLKSSEPIGRLRGQVHHYEGVPVIVTYHPAYLLRTPTDKGKAWADLCLAMAQLPG
jgi:uracil-DNA glycosylase family 4